MKQVFFEKDKVWQITVEGTSFITAYGKLNSDSLRESTKSFDSEEKTIKEADKLISKKLKSGYQKLHFNLEDSLQALCHLQVAQEEQTTSFKRYEDCSEAFIKELCKIESLENLTIAVRNILPACIGQLHNLKQLTISGNDLKYLPDELGQLSSLEKLSFENTRSLVSIPSAIGELKKLKKLSISYTGITSLPDGIGELEALEELKIEYNHKLRHFPTSIGQLKSLKKLSIENLCEQYNPTPSTTLEVLPEEIGLLSNLEELTLEFNTFKTLPKSIGQLKKLSQLSLSYNAFTEIPEGVFQLENLKELSIRNSAIVRLPIQFCLLKKLETFDCHSYTAKIENVPEELIENNNASSIQKYLIKHTALETLEEADKELLLSWRKELADNAPQPVEIPIPPTNKAALVKARKEKFDKFIREVKSRGGYNTMTQLEEIMLYLKGESSTLPTAHAGGEYDFESISKVLNSLEDWNFIDHRIITFIGQDTYYYKKDTYYKGYHEVFSRYVQQEILDHPNHPTLYMDLVNAVATYGLQEMTVLEGFLDELRQLPVLTEDKNVTSFGQYLLELFEQKPAKLVGLISKHSHATKFAELMVLYNKAGLEPHLPQLLAVKEYKGYDGTKHLPFLTLDVLCSADTTYEKYVLDGISKVDCISCIMECYRTLYSNNKETYAEDTLEKVKEALVHISNKKNGGERYQFQWSTANTSWTDDTASFIDWACGNFGAPLKQPVFEYVESTNALDLKVIQAAVKNYGQEAVDIAAEALNMAIKNDSLVKHYRTTFSILEPLDFSNYYDKVWEIAQSKFTAIANTACVALSKQEGSVIIPAATKLLTAKSIPVRRAGVFTLALINTPETQALIVPLLFTEKNEAIRNIIVQALMALPLPISIAEAQERVASAAARGKLSKPIAKWLEESTLPKLYWRNKTPLTTEEIRFLFYRQKSIDSIELDFEAREVFGLIDPSSSPKFAKALWSLLQKNGGAKAKNRFAMAVVAALADDQLTEPLYKETTTGKNLNSCAMLEVMNSLEAARTLDRIRQFFGVKYPNIVSAAERAFESIAESMQLSRFELLDKMLPDLGFKDLKREVAIGTDLYTAFLGKDFKFVYKDPAGKLVKSLSKADKPTKEEWKQLDKTIKSAGNQLLSNLEFYLVIQRAWPFPDWWAFFVSNPIAFAAAQNFVWQVYDPQNVAVGTFMLTAEQTLVDHQGQPYPVDEKASIRLAHPLLLTPQEISDWTTHTNQQKIKPPFPQLTRSVLGVAPSMQDQTMDYQYNNFRISGHQFKSRAANKGWKRGAVVDSGEISSYQKTYPTIGVQAIIKTSSLNVQYTEDHALLQEFYFVKSGSVNQGSYTYDEPREETDSRLIPFDKVPPIVYSETMADLQAIAAD